MQTRTTAARSVSATDVNYRTPAYIWLGLPENLLRERRNITLTGHHETQGVAERAFLAPLEARLWPFWPEGLARSAQGEMLLRTFVIIRV